MNRVTIAALLLLLVAAAAADETKWGELETPLPVFPKAENLVEFYAGAAASNRFFIDGSSLNVGVDGVVRYVLVVKTAGGATNISFEGLRCGAGAYKLYATGRSDGTWAKSHVDDWRPVENRSVNGYHAALSRDYFCPDHSPLADAAEGRNALRLGKNPRAP